MPNWCFNRLEVSKHNESGRKLIEAFRENHTNEKGEKYASPFEDLMPTPQELSDTEASFGNGNPETIAKHEANKAKYGHAHWYDWRLANWGTKWDACEIQFTDETDEYACFYFETAWCPPTELFRSYAEEHPDVVFLNEYDEEGCHFKGYDMNSSGGFVTESWEPREAPQFHELMEDVPKAVVEK